MAEWELILNLSRKMNVDDTEVSKMTICPRHRKIFTLLRDRKAKCSCPFHTGKNPVLKLTKRVTKDLSETFYLRLGILVPNGTGKLSLPNSAVVCTFTQKTQFITTEMFILNTFTYR